MAYIICLRVNWNNSSPSIPIPGDFHILNYGPSPDHPFGEKGKALAGAWKQLDPENEMDGMLILDGDVAIEPLDLTNMLAAIHEHGNMVVVAPARIWPISTKRKDWSWAHWVNKPSQILEIENVRWFTFNFTYSPRKVIEQALNDGLSSWTYPRVDKRVADAAFKAGIAVYVATDVKPKHLHF
jgi:hypothetical protein